MSRAAGSGPVLGLNSVRLFNPITKTDLSYSPKLCETIAGIQQNQVLFVPFFVPLFTTEISPLPYLSLYCCIIVLYSVLISAQTSSFCFGTIYPKASQQELSVKSASFGIIKNDSTYNFVFTLSHCAFRPIKSTKLNYLSSSIIILDDWLVHVSSLCPVKLEEKVCIVESPSTKNRWTLCNKKNTRSFINMTCYGKAYTVASLWVFCVSFCFAVVQIKTKPKPKKIKLSEPMLMNMVQRHSSSCPHWKQCTLCSRVL